MERMSLDRATNRLSSESGFFDYLRAYRHDIFYSILLRETEGLEDLGSAALGCNWTVCTRLLNSRSIVITAGVGRDVTFEHALSDRFGLNVFLLDPSPTGIKTMKLQENRRPEFRFFPSALGRVSGNVRLAPPPNPKEGSWVHSNLTTASDSVDSYIDVPCESLLSICTKLGITEVDLLKMDIEGAEFEVIESLVSTKILIRQIAVEFHNSVIGGVSRNSTAKAILALYRLGYRLVHKGGSNHTFILRKFL